MSLQNQQLSEHFYLQEFVSSQTAARYGITMYAQPEIVRCLASLCHHVLEPLRVLVKRPIIITSGYRPARLNRLIGGSQNSAHLDGRAADIIVPDLFPQSVAIHLRKLNPQYLDQCILEFNQWVHVGIAKHITRARQQYLCANHNDRGDTVYTEADY